MKIINNALLISVCVLLLAIFSCTKEAKKPPPEDYKASLNYANKLIEKEEYENARDILTLVKNSDTTKVYATIAQLKIAESYLKEEEIPSALDEYATFLKLYPDNKHAIYAQYQIAMIHYGQIESADKGYKSAEKALVQFEVLSDKYPRNPYRDVIPLRMEKCRNTLAAHDHYVAEFYYKKGSYDASLTRLNALISKYPDYWDIANVYYLMAMSYKALNQTDKAESFFNKTLSKTTDRKLIKKTGKEMKNPSAAVKRKSSKKKRFFFF